MLAHLRRHAGAPADLLWFVAGRAIEERVLATAAGSVGEVPLERVALRLEPPSGGAPSLGRLARRALPEVRRARAALLRHRSRVLLGLGGYTTLPAVLAARSLGIPVALLEINAVPGRATRSLGGLARRVYHAWPSTLPRRSSPRHVLLGPPLAPELLGARAAAAEARLALGFDPGRPLLLVLGGSQGALALNRFCRDFAPAIAAAGVQVLHQCGPGREAEAGPPTDGYRAAGYLDDVPGALAAATVVLCRGGASTVAEVAALARPAVVVPYPHHADRHQERNARLLGSGVRIRDEGTLDAALVEELVQLCGETGATAREEMSRALAAIVPLDAGTRIAEDLLWMSATP